MRLRTEAPHWLSKKTCTRPPRKHVRTAQHGIRAAACMLALALNAAVAMAVAMPATPVQVRVLKPGGTLVIACWCEREETPQRPFTEQDKVDLKVGAGVGVRLCAHVLVRMHQRAATFVFFWGGGRGGALTDTRPTLGTSSVWCTRPLRACE